MKRTITKPCSARQCMNGELLIRGNTIIKAKGSDIYFMRGGGICHHYRSTWHVYYHRTKDK